MAKLSDPCDARGKKLIRGFRGAILIPIWAFTFAGLASECLALEQIAAPHSGTGSIAPPRTPNAQGQLGITNKGSGSTTPGERQRTNDCAAAASAGSNVTACPPAKDAKGSEVVPAPPRKALPCIGYPDRQCL